MMLRKEVNNWFVKKTKHDKNIQKAYATILGKCTKGLDNKSQTEKNWETYVKNQPIGILKSVK